MRLRLSPQALRDIENVSDFTTARWGEAQATRYVADLRAGCDRLGRNHRLGRPRPAIPSHRLVYPVGRHLIIYEVDSAQDAIDILRVLHQAMDVAAHLPNPDRAD